MLRLALDGHADPVLANRASCRVLWVLIMLLYSSNDYQ